MQSERIAKALAVTAELANKELSTDAIRALMYHLSKYPEEAVLRAILRVQTEVRGFPSVSDITSRIEDGRPGPEAAWALVPKEEYQSVVWNNEIAEAFGVANPLLNSGDHIGARMAFKEAYERIVSKNRSEGKQPKWIPSFGTDKSGRMTAVIEAVDRKRIPIATALKMAPELEYEMPDHPLLQSPEAKLALGYSGDTSANQKKVAELISTMGKDLKNEI